MRNFIELTDETKKKLKFDLNKLNQTSFFDRFILAMDRPPTDEDYENLLGGLYINWRLVAEKNLSCTEVFAIVVIDHMCERPGDLVIQSPKYFATALRVDEAELKRIFLKLESLKIIKLDYTIKENVYLIRLTKMDYSCYYG